MAKTIGNKADLSQARLKGTVACGTCDLVFEDNDDYKDHVCPVTGYTPKDPEHLGKNFLRQSREALRRSNSLDTDRETQIEGQIKATDDEGVNYKLMEQRTKRKKKYTKTRSRRTRASVKLEDIGDKKVESSGGNTN